MSFLVHFLQSTGQVYDFALACRFALARKKRSNRTWTLMTVVFLTHGGGCVSRLLLGKVPPLLESPIDILVAVSACVLVMSTPFEIYAKIPIVKLFLAISDVLTSFLALSPAVELACNALPHSPLGSIFIIAVAGSAGGVISNLDLHYYDPKSNPTVSPSWFHVMLLSSYLVYSQQSQAYRQGLFNAILFPRMHVPSELFLLGILLTVMLPYGLFSEFSINVPNRRKSLPPMLDPIGDHPSSTNDERSAGAGSLKWRGRLAQQP